MIPIAMTAAKSTVILRAVFDSNYARIFTGEGYSSKDTHLYRWAEADWRHEPCPPQALDINASPSVKSILSDLVEDAYRRWLCRMILS